MPGAECTPPPFKTELKASWALLRCVRRGAPQASLYAETFAVACANLPGGCAQGMRPVLRRASGMHCHMHAWLRRPVRPASSAFAVCIPPHAVFSADGGETPSSCHVKGCVPRVTAPPPPALRAQATLPACLWSSAWGGASRPASAWRAHACARCCLLLRLPRARGRWWPPACLMASQWAAGTGGVRLSLAVTCCSQGG